MEEAQGRESQISGDEASAREGFAPLRIFLVLLLVAIVTSASALLLTDREPPTIAHEGSGFALSDTEAIDRFRELQALRRRAYISRDTSLISLYLHSNSSLRGLNFREIRDLKRKHKYFRPVLSIHKVTIEQNTSTEIVIRQKLTEEPRFFSESGKEITAERSRIHQLIRWTLRPDNSEWMIFDARVLRAKVNRIR